MTLIMVLGFSACGNEPSTSADLASSTEGVSQPDSGGAVDSGESTANTVATESGNALVIYYSATGNTKEIANYIADAVSADLFELEPSGHRVCARRLRPLFLCIEISRLRISTLFYMEICKKLRYNFDVEDAQLIVTRR